MIDLNKLSVGTLFPIESYEGAVPKMEDQTQLIQRAEALSFDTVWVRDVLLNNPDFKEVGQIFGPWIHLPHTASLTESIKFGIASVILSLRHPLHVAKASASLDVFFSNRFMMGVAFGDRPVKYPAFNKPFELGSTRVSEHMRMFRELRGKGFSTYNNDYGTLMANVGDVVPKPVHKNIPMYATGHAGGVNLDWIAKNSDGWIYHPRNFAFIKKIVQDWEEALQKEGRPKKPYTQSVYIDLMEDSSFKSQKIDLDFRLGRTYPIDTFQELEKIGVNHTMLVFKYCSCPAGEVLEEIGKDTLP